MPRSLKIFWVLSTAIVLAAGVCFAAPATRDYGVVKNQASPYARLHSVDLSAVHWTKGFWAKRFAQTREVTLPRLWELAADPTKGHAIQNLRIAAGLEKGEFAGTNWQDAWVYKWLEAASYVYAATHDPKLLAQMDRIIAVIEKAQQPDGYIASQITVRGWKRFEEPGRHELYTMGHLITAACEHYRITGRTALLDVARKAADYIYDTFKTRNPKLADFPRNPSIIMAGAELYRTTGERRYLDMANFFIDWRGSRYGDGRRNVWGPARNGSDLNQNWRPLRKETEVVGHAVFFTYLYGGAADAYMETGDKTLLEALERLWADLVNHKMYVTGGVSPMHKAHPVRRLRPGHLDTIAGDSIHEGVGAPYDLPNSSAYNETCGQIGDLMWNWRMLLITGQARFADVMEQTIYNSILSGINVSGKGWSYTNPLRWYGAEQLLRSNDAHQRFDPGAKHICCPTNLLRLLASWNDYLYTTSADGLWVHHYGGNRLETTLENGTRLVLREETGYPWDGAIKFTVEQVSPSRAFSIALRIPAWAQEATLKVNGRPAGGALAPSSYATLRRKWVAGDVIELNLPMPVRLIGASPFIEQTRNQVAVMRGPIVYCLESTDLPAGVRFEDVTIPAAAEWKAEWRPELLGGVTVLRTRALALDKSETPELGPYRAIRAVRTRPVEIMLIPYYAWNNRGEPKMSVWLPVRW